MPVDPRLNCAAEICCGPPPAAVASRENGPAAVARIALLVDLGVPTDLAPRVSVNMVARGIVFLSAELATAIREIAFPNQGNVGESPTERTL